MKRTLALILALCLTVGGAYAADLGAADYTTAGKLVKQLWAGSGFSGTLRLEILPKDGADNVLRTKQPLDIAIDYIYVREDELRADEHRLDLTFGDAGMSNAHINLKDGIIALNSNIIGSDWYALPAGGGLKVSGVTAEGLPEALQTELGDIANPAELTGIPALTGFMLPIALRLGENPREFDDVIDAYSTRIDLWIEGYRQSAVLGKLEDGTTTMTTSYILPPAAIKAQAKQLVLDLLGDTAALSKLTELLGEESAAQLLDPRLQGYYFDSIDALPIEGDMALERTVSFKGDTLLLKISLPIYDAKGGAGTLRYERESGLDDIPDQNVIELITEAREASVTYRAFESDEGVKVWQGSVLSLASGAGSFSVGDDAEKASAPLDDIAADFTLSLKETVGRDEEDRDTLEYGISLTLEPQEAQGEAAFKPLDIKLTASFASKTLKTASTEMNAKLTIDGEGRESVTALELTGKTRKKWTPEPLPAGIKSIAELTDAEVFALMPGIITRGGALLASCFDLPMPSIEETDANMSEEPEADAEPTREIFPTLAPGETLEAAE